MDNPRAEKVAVVDEVRDRLAESDGALLTEYRGLTVAEMAELRQSLSAAGGDYKIYKNTLVKIAVAGGPQAPMHELLSGPTAIAFVRGDVSAVAKALRDFSRANPNLVVKGGMIGEGVVSASDINALAELPSREVLLAQFAGALIAPLRQLANLVEALPRNFAYGLSALLDQKQATGESLPEAAGAPAESDIAPSAEAEANAEAEAPTEEATAEAEAAPAEAETEPSAEAEAPAEAESGE
jgi:large subunit ribosomal protein L10